MPFIKQKEERPHYQGDLPGNNGLGLKLLGVTRSGLTFRRL
jgi:hypothetical protein